MLTVLGMSQYQTYSTEWLQPHLSCPHQPSWCPPMWTRSLCCSHWSRARRYWRQSLPATQEHPAEPLKQMHFMSHRHRCSLKDCPPLSWMPLRVRRRLPRWGENTRCSSKTEHSHPTAPSRAAAPSACPTRDQRKRRLCRCSHSGRCAQCGEHTRRWWREGQNWSHAERFQCPAPWQLRK